MVADTHHTRIYYSIINKAQAETRVRDNGTYYEEHHIIPKCLGGSDNSENLVLLTFREHFLCHWLLTKMAPSDMKYKLQFAFVNMSRISEHQERKLTSRQYEIIKKHNREACKKRKVRTGFKMSDEAKQKMREAKKDQIQIYHDELKIKKWCHKDDLNTWLEQGYRVGSIGLPGDKNPMFGKKQTEETKAKIGKANSRCTLTEEGRRRKAEFTKTNNPMSNPKLKEKMRLGKQKNYKLTDPEGNVHLVTGLKDFCREHNLSDSNLVSVSKGKLNHYKKWRCQEII